MTNYSSNNEWKTLYEKECNDKEEKSPSTVEAIFQEILEAAFPSDDQINNARLSLKRKAEIFLFLLDMIFGEDELPSPLGSLFALVQSGEDKAETGSTSDPCPSQSVQKQSTKNKESQILVRESSFFDDTMENSDNINRIPKEYEMEKQENDHTRTPKKRRTKYTDFYGDMSNVYRDPKRTVGKKQKRSSSLVNRDAYETESTCSSSTDEQMSSDEDGDIILARKLIDILIRPLSSYHQRLVLTLLHSDQNLMSLFVQERAKLGKMEIPVFKEA